MIMFGLVEFIYINYNRINFIKLH